MGVPGEAGGNGTNDDTGHCQEELLTDKLNCVGEKDGY